MKSCSTSGSRTNANSTDGLILDRQKRWCSDTSVALQRIPHQNIFKRARNPPRTGRFPDDPRLYRGSHRRGSGVWATNALTKLCTRMTSHQSTRAVGRFPLPHVPIHPCTSRYNTRLGAKLSDHQSGEKPLLDAQATLFSDLHVAEMDMLLFFLHPNRAVCLSRREPSHFPSLSTGKTMVATISAVRSHFGRRRPSSSAEKCTHIRHFQVGPRFSHFGHGHSDVSGVPSRSSAAFYRARDIAFHCGNLSFSRLDHLCPF